MYINLVHKNTGAVSADDPEEGKVAAGADVTIRIFASMGGVPGYGEVVDALRAKLGAINNIPANERTGGRIEIRHGRGACGKNIPAEPFNYQATVYGFDSKGNPTVNIYRFVVEK